jgi:large subunit ribosomal protein L18
MAKLSLFEKRRQRVRTKLRVKGTVRPRLSVHRSGRHIYAQIIDDTAGKTGATCDGATDVGKRVAAAAKKAGVTQVVFDRGGFLFHGRVKALADGAREGGLEF